MNTLKTTAAALLVLLGACSSSEKEPDPGANTVERQYGKPAADVCAAAVSALKSYDLRIDSDRHDELGGEVIARRADGHRVTAKVAALDPKSSHVSMRVEPGNREMAQVLQERIADKLGMGTAKPALLGGNSVEGSYAGDFPAAISAAERSCQALRYLVTGKELLDKRARVDARAPDSTPLRFEITPSGKSGPPLRVRFIAGNGKTDGGKTLASGMKAEFDRQMAEQLK
jgi:hypothetical protein